MNVLFLSPGFPAEMPYFTRGLDLVGARVIGLGDQPTSALPEMTRRHLSHYHQIASWGDERAVLAEVAGLARKIRIDRVECMWETQMIAAAKMREMLELPGMTVAETIPFRDKEVMKQVLDAQGIRTPRHANATTSAGVVEAAERIGFPLIVKPIAGAGSMDTYRIDSAEELEAVLPKLRHVPEVSVEEFVEGTDCTFDTVCADGRVLYHNICFYRPRALESRNNEWMSPQTIAVREPEHPQWASGFRMGFEVLKALNFRTGFTHMEWYRKPDGEAVFGEIGGRAPGARTVDVMNFACDLDLFRGWAEAACFGRLSQPVTRKYNAANVMKRSEGQGRIQRVEGLDRLVRDLGPAIAAIELNQVGQPKRSMTTSIVGDGFVMVRHPELDRLIEIADRVSNELKLYAG